jgi:transposase InsO family protein
MSSENPLWGQRRVQAELARLGFSVSARTVATYRRRPYDGVPSPSWREFLTRQAKDIWACDFFSVRTIFFQTLDVFFVMRHETRQIVQVRVTRHPTAAWAAQQVLEACGWDRDPPRYLLRDRDGRFGVEFDRRVQRRGVMRIRTPVRAPRANALAERWIRSARSECLDHVVILNEDHLRGCWTSTWCISMPGDPIRSWAKERCAGGRRLPDPTRRAESSAGWCSAGCIMRISTQRDGVLAPFTGRRPSPLPWSIENSAPEGEPADLPWDGHGRERPLS